MSDREHKRRADGPAEGSSKRHKGDPRSSHHASSSAGASSSHPHSSSRSAVKADPSKQGAAAGSAPLGANMEASMSKKPKSEFLCDLQYTNHLPDIPFAPKLLKIHLPPQRLLRYCASSLETSQKIPFLTDKLMGMPLDLLHPAQYARPAGVAAGALDPADMAIVPVTREALAAGARPQPTQAELFQQGSSNWLRKQEFQSNNPYEMGIKSFGASDSISKEIVRITHLKKETEAQNSRERQIELIETSFKLAQQTPVHPTNPSLSVVEVLDIFPDLLPSSSASSAAATEGEAAPAADSVDEYVLAHNKLFPPISEEEDPAEAARLRAERAAQSIFNVEYTWAEFDYAPLDNSSKPATAAGKAGEAGGAAAMETDDGAAGGAAAPRQVPLLKSYNQSYHGLYVSDPSLPYGRLDKEEPVAKDADEEDDDDGTGQSKRRAAAAALKAAREAAEQARNDPNIERSEFYAWRREYVKVPTPRVEQSNNYFFIVKGSAAGGAGASGGKAVFYSQYGERIKIAKRTKTRTDKAFHEIQKRPSAVRLHYVKQMPLDSSAAGAAAAAKAATAIGEVEDDEDDEEAEEEDEEDGEGDKEEGGGGSDKEEEEEEDAGADEAEEQEEVEEEEEDEEEGAQKKSKKSKKSKKHKKEKKEKAAAASDSSDDE